MQQSVQAESPKKQSPTKISPSKKNDTTVSDEANQTSPTKFKIRSFDISPTKQKLRQDSATDALAVIAKANLRKFDDMLTETFGLRSGKDIYPQYEATPLERSIGITERFFGRKPQYYNIMNKTLKKIKQAADLVSIKYEVHSFEFNPHVDMPELYTEKVNKIETVHQIKSSIHRKKWNETEFCNDKENEKDRINRGPVSVFTGENTLKPEVKMANTGTGIGSDKHHSTQ